MLVIAGSKVQGLKYGIHWGQGGFYPGGTLWVHCKFWRNSPTIYPLGTYWVLLKCAQWFDQKEISRYIVITFEKYPPIYPAGTFQKNPEVSFVECPSIQPQFTQWVLCKELSKNSQCGLILPWSLKEPTIHPVGKLWSNWWVLGIRTTQVTGCW